MHLHEAPEAIETHPSPQDSWVYRVLGDQNFAHQKGFFAIWYRLTSSPDAPPDATFGLRERIRRSRLASALMLFLGTVLLLAGLIGATSPNHTILIVVSSMLLAILVSIPMNRHGRVKLVGLLMILGLTVGMYTSIGVDAFSVGMSPNDKDILYLLFFSELFAGALLPNWVFVLAAINIAFSYVALRFFPHDPALVVMLKSSFPAIFPRLVQIHIIASGVMWILVNNLKAALERANRAEEIAKLQHDLAALASEQAAEKQELERQIAAIVAVHTQISQGNLRARVPLIAGNTLWNLAGPLNTLLDRYQHARVAEEQMQHLVERIAQTQQQVQQEIAAALAERRPLHFPPHDPLFVPLSQALHGKIMTPSPQPPSRLSGHLRSH
ncbi:MAG TPA: hypothetical protein VFV38_09520 [Ktedonobacteraceae bacterium]|nr:hypothetical protein [Ktedonobacteraceae bacterium]